MSGAIAMISRSATPVPAAMATSARRSRWRRAGITHCPTTAGRHCANACAAFCCVCSGGAPDTFRFVGRSRGPPAAGFDRARRPGDRDGGRPPIGVAPPGGRRARASGAGRLRGAGRWTSGRAASTGRRRRTRSATIDQAAPISTPTPITATTSFIPEVDGRASTCVGARMKGSVAPRRARRPGPGARRRCRERPRSPGSRRRGRPARPRPRHGPRTSSRSGDLHQVGRAVRRRHPVPSRAWRRCPAAAGSRAS